MEIHIQDKIEWSFSQDYPSLFTGHYRERIDPTPCYTHDENTLRACFPILEKAFAIDPAFAPDFHLLKYETLARVNGWTSREFDWPQKDENKDNPTWKAVIAFSGKRIPIHPAMTRYLAGHEYGHVLRYWLEYKQGFKETSTENSEVYNEYAKMRGLDLNADYGPGNWATNIGEIFANDFRITLTGLEKEFWPHSTAPRPEELPQIKKWWKEQAKKYAYRFLQQPDR